MLKANLMHVGMSLLLLGWVISPFSTPATAESTPLDLKCVKGDDQRRVTVVPKEQGCEVHYSREGQSDVIAKSLRDAGHCDKVQSNVRQNLEVAGFACD